MAELMKGEVWADACKLVRGVPRFTYPIMVEVKADEIRCRVQCHRETHGEGGPVVEFITYESYAGKPLHNLSHLDGAFNCLRQASGISEFDVGILVNGNFNDSYRWTRSSKGYPQEKLDKKTGKVAPALFPKMVQVILFDMPQNPRPYVDRMIEVDFAAAGLRSYGMDCIRPTRRLCHNEESVMQTYAEYRAAGFEGAMGKTLDHLYERRRTYGWMKIKPKETFDGRITGFNEATSEAGVPLARVGSINVELEDGSTGSPAGIPHALGRELWENQAKYIGQWIEFECMERDRKGGFRHPIYNRFREDKA